MFGKRNQNQPSGPSVNPGCIERANRNPAREAEPPSTNGKDAPQNRVSAFSESTDQKGLDLSDPAVPESKSKSGFQKIWGAANAFLDSLNEEGEPEPPPEKPLKETVQEFIGRCRDREKRTVMLKEFGKWSLAMSFRGAVFLILFVLAIWGTILALDFSENHHIKFLPPDDVVNYLAAEHEHLEEEAYRVTPPAGRDDIPSERFDAKFIETVKPIRIYGDEYGVYFMTSKGWYNGEHGLFIAKDEENMPPDLNWGLIEGRIYTYAIYD